MGKAIVEQLLAAGHEVTLHNRGLSRPLGRELFPHAEHLIGDRNGDLRELDGRSWDIAIDVNGYLPLAVKHSTEKLASSVGLLCFVSTVSVLDSDGVDSQKRMGEESAMKTFTGKEGLNPSQETDRRGDIHYGPMKALCEQAAEAAMPGRVLTIRPGIVIGNDCGPTFALWYRRHPA